MNINFESIQNCCIPRRHRLLVQTTKQPLSNFEPQKTWKWHGYAKKYLKIFLLRYILRKQKKLNPTSKLSLNLSFKDVLRLKQKTTLSPDFNIYTRHYP